MPTPTSVISAREAFEKQTSTLAPTAAVEQALKGETKDLSQPPALEAETEPSESSAEETVVVGDETVDSSAAPDEADASDDSEPADHETAEPQPAKVKGRAQSRIEDLVASNKALKASLDYMQNEVLTKLQPQPQTQQPTAQSAPAAEEAPPTLESVGFDTDKWTQAMHAWTRKQIDSGVQRAVQTVQQNQTQATRQAAFDTRMTAFGAATPDLQVVLGNPALPRLSKEAASLVVDSDVGPQILYHLGKNPEKAARIARQTPVQQAAAIGRLEAELATKPLTQKKQTTNITRAPSPPTPTKGGGASKTDLSKGPISDFIAQERAAMVAKRGRAR